MPYRLRLQLLAFEVEKTKRIFLPGLSLYVEPTDNEISVSQKDSKGYTTYWGICTPLELFVGVGCIVFSSIL